MPVNKNNKVLLGMSGGVDSSVAAVLLLEQGFDVIGVTFKFWCDSRYNKDNSDTVADARRICRKLGIEHHELDIADIFKKEVVDKFIKSYAEGKTPNPCVECNKHIKFGVMLDFADKLGAYYISTGHYAVKEFDEAYGTEVIKLSANAKKDQTYMLYVMDKSAVPRVLFPLGKFADKDEIRKIAEKYGFVSANKPDSQEICFIPDNDTGAFLDRYIKQKPGDIIKPDGTVLGKHKGLCHYTIGQRKGLGISAQTPLFVTKLDTERNTITVTEHEKLFTSELHASSVNWLVFDELTKPIRLTAKIRYAARAVPCEVTPLGNGKIKAVFDEPQRAITPGQSVVFYDGDVLVGGGIIE